MSIPNAIPNNKHAGSKTTNNIKVTINIGVVTIVGENSKDKYFLITIIHYGMICKVAGCTIHLSYLILD